MKNIFRTIAAFAAISLVFASCTREELIPETPKGPTHTVKFTTGIPETKTDMSIDGTEVTFTWSTDDLTRLTIKENGKPGTIDTEKSSITANELVVYATFEGEANTDPKTYTALLNGIVGDQTPREDSYDLAADVLIAKPVVATAAEAIKFQFGRPVAINKMTLCDLPAGETLTSVKVSSDKDIAGTVGEDGWENPATELTLTVGRTIPENGEVVLYYTSVPAEDANLIVEATVGADSYKKVFGKGLTTTAGNVKGYSVGLKKQAHMVLTENFSSSKATNDNYNCGSNITTADNRTDFDYVWSQSGSGTVFKNGIKLGGSDKTGSVSNETMIADFAAGTKFYVKVYAAVWNTDGGKIKVTYNEASTTLDAANAAIISTTSAYSGDDFKESTDFEFVKVEGKNTIKIESTKNRLLIDKVEIVYDGDAPTSISASDIEDVAAAGVNDATFNFTAVNVTGNPEVTCDGTVVTAASVEGRTVTYTVSENTTYKARQGSITITIGTDEKVLIVSQNGIVPSYTGSGTLDDPYTVADALLKIETLADDEASEEVYVTGAIRQVVSFSKTYCSIDYKIGSDKDNSLLIYGGLDFDGKKFSAIEDLSFGQNVVVKGQLTIYDSTKEMKSNNQLAMVNGKDYALKSIAVTGAKTVFDEGQEFSTGDAVVTASYRGNKENTTVTASAEFTGYESTVGQHDITVSYSENGFTKTTQYQVTVASSTIYGISVNQTGTGSGTVTYTVNGESGITESKAGATVVVTVTPAAKNHVEAFSVTGLTGTQALEDGEYEFTMPEGDVTINVQFEPNPAATDGTTLWSYDFTTTSVYPGASVNYSYSSSSYQNENLAGGVAPEYLIGKNGGSMTITGVPTGGATAMTLTFLSNHADYLMVSVTGVTGGSSEDIEKATGKSQAGWKITVPDNTDNFNIVVTNTNGSNARIDDLKLVVGAPKSAQTISFAKSSKTITLGAEFEINGTYEIQAASLDEGDGAITYSVTEGADVVSVYASTGKVTILKAGTATITATAAETDTYKSATASYALTIKEAGSTSDYDVTYTLTDATLSQSVDSNVSLTFNANGGTPPAWYDPEVRTYENNQTTLSCDGGLITKIVFTYSISNSGSLTPSVGSYDSSNKTWTGSSESVTFTTGHSSGTKNGQVRISKIEVFYTK